MLTPNHIVIMARVVLVLGALTAVTLMLGPFQGMERLLGLDDKSAHAIAFGGLTAVSFAAFPRLRRADLARTALLLGGAVEIAQLFGGRSASLIDWLADAAGIFTVYGSSLIESGRKMAREQGELSLASIAAMDRRRPRRIFKAAFTPNPVAEGPRPLRFADRAAKRFPSRR